jgi:hypothetical protein
MGLAEYVVSYTLNRVAVFGATPGSAPLPAGLPLARASKFSFFVRDTQSPIHSRAAEKK